MTREEVFDTKIMPLLKQVAEICLAEDIPYAAIYQINDDRSSPETLHSVSVNITPDSSVRLSRIVTEIERPSSARGASPPKTKPLQPMAKLPHRRVDLRHRKRSAVSRSPSFATRSQAPPPDCEASPTARGPSPPETKLHHRKRTFITGGEAPPPACQAGSPREGLRHR